MIDYKLLNALAMVVQEGGFERAARVLLLTQSAVSQRIRLLEDQSGQLLLTRTSPPQPTAAGKALLKHYQQVRMLESALAGELSGADSAGPQQLAIGINADSLDYWFIDAVAPLLQEAGLLLDLRVDDQEQTHRYLRDGDVVGCISAESRAMQGCRVDRLGGMRYRLVATPGFKARWFPEGLTRPALEQAPAVIFNRHDRLHQQFIETYISSEPVRIPAHYIPAPAQFLQVIREGYCYGMVPDWQSRDLLAAGILQEFIGDASLSVTLYWHSWNLSAAPLNKLTEQLRSGAQKYLFN